MPRGRPRAPAVVSRTVYEASDGSTHATHREAAEWNRLVATRAMLLDAVRAAPERCGDAPVGPLADVLGFIAEHFNVTPRKPKAKVEGDGQRITQPAPQPEDAFLRGLRAVEPSEAPQQPAIPDIPDFLRRTANAEVPDAKEPSDA